MITSLLSFSLTQIGILTGLAVLVITVVSFDIAVGVSLKKKRQTSPQQQVIPVAVAEAPAVVVQPAPPPMPVIIAPPVQVSEEAVEAAYERIRLVRSYLAKLIQTSDETKQLYNELKNELLAYKGVKDRISWKWESFRSKKTPVAHIGVRGKTLCLYLALDPQSVDGKYKVEDVGNLSSCEETPLLYRIKNPLRMRYAKELIAQMMAQLGIERTERENEDFTAGLEYRGTPALIIEGLIRVPEGVELPTFTEISAGTEVAAEEAETSQPEVLEEPTPSPQPEQTEVAADGANITAEEEETLSRLKLDRSFMAKLILTEEETKQLYAELKRELLSYRGVHTRISWRRETFSKSRVPLARLVVRGKTLCLCLALQPADFAESKYKTEDVGGQSSFADTPLMYRIKNPLRMRYAKELISILMAERGIERAEYTGEDPMSGLEYRSTPTLIDEGLIRVPAGMELPEFTEPVQQSPEEVPDEVPAEVAGEVASDEIPEEQPADAAENVPDEVSEATGEPIEEAEDIDGETVVLFERNSTQYNRSFTAKLIQSDDEVKDWYAQLKNELLSYKKVKARMSWKRESYRLGRKNAVRISFRGNTLCVYLMLDPAAYADSKYKVEDLSGNAAYAETPCLYRMKNEKRVRYAKDLIAAVMESIGAVRNDNYLPEDYYLPYEDTGALIERGLIKVIGEAAEQTDLQEVPAEAAEEVAAEVVEEVAEDVPAEAAEEVSADEIPEEPAAEVYEVPAEAVEEVAEDEIPEEQPAEEETVTEAVVEELADEETEIQELAEEEIEVEELSKREIKDVQSYEEEAKDDDGIEVVGVMFRRRGRKVYWFDPDGKEWQKGEIALYKSPDNPPQEVIVVDNAKISPSKLHLPLKPLHKASAVTARTNRHTV